MHPRLLDYYNRELAHLRDMSAEFAQEYPKVAARLGLEGMEVADPYVERLMEGFAFVAARVQLKLDAEFPRFTQHLLEMVYPHLLAPTPSFGIVSLQPNFSEGSLARGVDIPRGSVLRSVVPRGQQTACEFRTAHAVRLYPVELVSAAYFTQAADLPLGRVAGGERMRSGLRLKLACHAGLLFSQLECDALTLHLNAAGDLAVPLYELMFAHCSVIAVVQGSRLLATLAPDALRPVGFEEDEALLPFGPRSFAGYRYLQEYFAFHERFMFLEIRHLARAMRQADSAEIEIVLLFDHHDSRLDGTLDAATFSLYATPVVNLARRRADRMPVSDGEFEHHLVVDRTRPLDYEVFALQSLHGYGDGEQAQLEFLPFYASSKASAGREAYYTLRREPRMLSSRRQQLGGRSSYAGTEVFVSLVDAHEAPYPASIRQLGAEVWVTNRDLPLLLPVAAQNPLSLESSAPVSRILMLRGPTRPRTAIVEGDYAWRLVHHLSLNYLSLIDEEGGLPALRNLLQMYCDPGNAGMRKQIEALHGVRSHGVVRRLPIPGPIAFGRGIAIDLQVDESHLPGSGAFLLGTVLDRFFAQYVSINAFTQTRLLSDARGEVHQWPARCGQKTLA